MPTSQRTKGSGSQGSQAGTGRVTGQGLGGSSPAVCYGTNFRLTQNQRRELPGSTTQHSQGCGVIGPKVPHRLARGPKAATL